MRDESRRLGRWLAGSGLTLAGSYLIATASLKQRIPAFPYLIFFSMAIIGAAIYILPVLTSLIGDRIDSMQPDPQGIAVLALDCSSMTAVPGSSITLEYRIRSWSDRAFPAELGASLISENGGEFYDKAGDRQVELTSSEAIYHRPLRIPLNVPPGRYRLIGAVWYPRIGKHHLGGLDRGFIVNVVGSEAK
jgi:hypothetical protein